MAKQEIIQKAHERGYNDGWNGYPGPDAADIADLITEAASDEMEAAEYNQAAAAVADAYAEGYRNEQAWQEWENKQITITQDDLSRLLDGVKMLSEGRRLTTSEQRDVWMLLHNRIAKLVESEPKFEWQD